MHGKSRKNFSKQLIATREPPIKSGGEGFNEGEGFGSSSKLRLIVEGGGRRQKNEKKTGNWVGRRRMNVEVSRKGEKKLICFKKEDF